MTRGKKARNTRWIAVPNTLPSAASPVALRFSQPQEGLSVLGSVNHGMHPWNAGAVPASNIPQQQHGCASSQSQLKSLWLHVSVQCESAQTETTRHLAGDLMQLETLSGTDLPNSRPQSRAEASALHLQLEFLCLLGGRGAPSSGLLANLHLRYLMFRAFHPDPLCHTPAPSHNLPCC